MSDQPKIEIGATYERFDGVLRTVKSIERNLNYPSGRVVTFETNARDGYAKGAGFCDAGLFLQHTLTAAGRR